MRSFRDERGLATLELAFAIPVLLLAIGACFQGALYFHASQVTQRAAEDGAATARFAGGTVAEGEAVARDTLAQLGGAAVESAEVTATRQGDLVRVEVSGRAPGPFFDLAVRAASSGRVERFRAEEAP